MNIDLTPLEEAAVRSFVAEQNAQRRLRWKLQAADQARLQALDITRPTSPEPNDETPEQHLKGQLVHALESLIGQLVRARTNDETTPFMAAKAVFAEYGEPATDDEVRARVARWAAGWSR